ncbi:glycosyltransferase family 2 protein [Plantactinospora sp. S1510]|uniref:Glycosyltransferase family 2 protein n=1 Tax=Plantactinospora alkalitolerans TaxID=2789879 RepID=A0ABS0GVA9_9ACTN|nr:glycosyltransferase family 2 protein [Plantactinospora alkalitolerans]MBF9130127.1 glycosyltransferase family 2 protein [Plantactinospora alkalitolerans]
MNKPLVSVIVPNYNYAGALGLCLDSLREQTYPNVEIIVVDDCSTDDSVAVARSYGARVLRTPRNSGPAAARNLGAANATGEILFFVDSDVAAKPDAVANAVELLGADPEIGAICGNYDPVPLVRDSLLEEYRCLQQSYWLIADEGRIMTLYTALLAIPARVFAEIGPFNPRLRETENADYGMRLAQRYQIWLSPRVRGVHDHDHDLGVLVRKVFTRTALHIPMYARKPEFPGGLSSGPRAWVSIAALLTVLTVVLPLLLGPAYLAVPLVAFAACLAGDLPMYRFVRRERGVVFLGYFVAMHFLLNLVIAVAALSGAVAWVASRRFRGLYDRPEVATR